MLGVKRLQLCAGNLADKRVLLRQTDNGVAACLTEQERQVVVLRYGLGGGVPLRQRQVAEKLGISRSYISRIEKRALGKLRQALE